MGSCGTTRLWAGGGTTTAAGGPSWNEREEPLAPLPRLAVADENDDDDDKDGRGRCCWSCTSDAPKTSNGLELPPWPDEEPPRDNDDEDDDNDAATGGAEEAKGSNMLNGLPLADMIGMAMAPN